MRRCYFIIISIVAIVIVGAATCIYFFFRDFKHNLKEHVDFKTLDGSIRANITINCDRNQTHLDEMCFIECSINASIYNKNYRKVKVSCQSPEAWRNFSSIKINLNGSFVNQTELLFLDSDFQEDFNVYNFTKLLGLKVDTVTVATLKKKLQNLPRNFLFNSSFERFAIISVDIESIPENFFHTSDIKFLTFKNTKLKELKSNDLSSLRHLKELKLSFNEISEIESGTFDNLIDLDTLDLSSNKLSSLATGIFKNLSNLSRIYLSSNNLPKLPDDLFHIKNNNALKEVYLQRNQLTELPENLFRNLNNLTFLDLTDNKLSSLPVDLFKGLYSLYWLSLNENNLKDLTSGVFKDTNLNYLYLSANRLNHLSPYVLN